MKFMLRVYVGACQCLALSGRTATAPGIGDPGVVVLLRPMRHRCARSLRVLCRFLPSPGACLLACLTARSPSLRQSLPRKAVSVVSKRGSRSRVLYNGARLAKTPQQRMFIVLQISTFSVATVTRHCLACVAARLFHTAGPL